MTRRRAARLADVLLLIGACSLLAAACSAGGTGPGVGTAAPAPATSAPRDTAPATTTPVAPASWSPCGAGLECATVGVPLDYAHPDAGTIPLAVERRRASGLRVGSLLLNPGGPGESGIDSMDLFTQILSPTLLDRFDLVTFDPRGVGRSEGVRCLDGPALDAYFDVDPSPRTAQALAALVAADRALAAGCAARAGNLLAHIGTIDAARDMDRIRAALGEDKLTFFGFSYGTLLGAEYAELYPGRVRAMVLDGAVDPAVDPVTADDQQAAGLDGALSAFFTRCAASPSCAWRPGGDLRGAFDRLMAAVRAHPLPVGGRRLGPGEAFLGVVTPLYNESDWPVLAQALARLETGDGGPLLRLFDTYAQRHADGTYNDAVEADAAVSCADQRWPTDPAAYPALAAAAARAAPEFGAANVYSGLQCAVWPVHPDALPVGPLHARGAPPLVVVGSTADPVTPYAWSQGLAAELDHAILLTRVGGGHTGYESSACVRSEVDPYLVNLTLPASGRECPSSGS